ncbi:hypothetical protein AYO40_06480 [Planctomycetaceae bacterium SCGC AG-212-D15]|nr:hypothetical protein AYO40_06480 [Planctomycetaceae bacterium SCGC AG-212-D15]
MELVELLIKAVVVGSFIGLIYYALQPRYVFVVQIDGGVLRVTKGKVTSAFLQVIEEACARNGVRRGWVGGVSRGREIGLVFSRSIPPACRQQLRNLWVMER